MLCVLLSARYNQRKVKWISDYLPLLACIHRFSGTHVQTFMHIGHLWLIGLVNCLMHGYMQVDLTWPKGSSWNVCLLNLHPGFQMSSNQWATFFSYLSAAFVRLQLLKISPDYILQLCTMHQCLLLFSFMVGEFKLIKIQVPLATFYSSSGPDLMFALW